MFSCVNTFANRRTIFFAAVKDSSFPSISSKSIWLLIFRFVKDTSTPIFTQLSVPQSKTEIPCKLKVYACSESFFYLECVWWQQPHICNLFRGFSGLFRRIPVDLKTIHMFHNIFNCLKTFQMVLEISRKFSWKCK